MSEVQATQFPCEHLDPSTVNATSGDAIQSRHAIALDAVSGSKEFAQSAVQQYLNTLADSFDAYALRQPANGLLDSKVLESIDRSLPALKGFREIIAAIADGDSSAKYIPALVNFFDAIVVLKRPPVSQVSQCVLWADAYRFIVREFFLTTVAILIDRDAYHAAVGLMSAEYAPLGSAESGPQRFVVCDAYVKTLDEFRNRRLQLNRLSVSSDLMRQRCDPAYCDFAAMMQADFLLCLRSLVCEKSFFVRWYPRTLVYAENFMLTGFELFISSADPARFSPLATLLDVADRAQLVERFDAVRAAWGLDQWELGNMPLDFHGYMGLHNPALRH